MASERHRYLVVCDLKRCESSTQLWIVLLRQLLHLVHRRQGWSSREIIDEHEILEEVGEQQDRKRQPRIFLAQLRLVRGAFLVVGLYLRLNHVGAGYFAALLQFAADVEEMLCFVVGCPHAPGLSLRRQQSVKRPHYRDR